MGKLWKRLDRSAALSDEVYAELVWMLYQSRFGIRWSIIAIDLPLVFLLVHRSEILPNWLVSTFFLACAVRIALSETYAFRGSQQQSRTIQRRWDAAYLAVGIFYVCMVALLATHVIVTGDPWLIAWIIGNVVGYSYGIVGYVANRPLTAYAMTHIAMIGSLTALASYGEDITFWMATNLVIACLAICNLIERHYAATLRSIADRRQVELFAETDHLTGLWNRRRLEAVVQQVLAEKLLGLHWLGVDLDRFKAVNDRLGHEAGDLVLKEVAIRIQMVAGQDAFVARVGGDEFVVLLIGDDDFAASMASRIAACLAEPLVLPQGIARIGASVGTTALSPSDTMDEVARRADERMYARKSESRLAA